MMRIVYLALWGTVHNARECRLACQLSLAAGFVPEAKPNVLNQWKHNN